LARWVIKVMTTEGRAGTDEAGKGDYFGPLVVAAVAARDAAGEKRLRALGARDSKKLSDRRVTEIARAIVKESATTTVVINPARYNELYDRMGNLNLILAWAHARALENLLQKTPSVAAAITDKFGDERFVKRALMKRGRRITLIQKPGAEEETVVAAASVVARAEFLRRLALLGAAAGLVLPKGASAAVEETARRLVAAKGLPFLRTVAKVHFKTTSRLGLGTP